MIFDNNTTALGASVIPMDEAYNCPYGTALALVESARSEMAMFEAMLRIDASEMKIRRESTGVVAEGELTSLSEAATGGIWKKIKEIFSKLIAKVKAIFHNFMGRINGLIMKDETLVKKYKTEVSRREGINNLEVKWCKRKGEDLLAYTLKTAEISQLDSLADRVKGKDGSDEYVKEFLGCEESEFNKKFREDHFEDQTTVKLSEVGGISEIISYIEGFKSKSNNMNKNINNLTTKLTALVKEADKRAAAQAGADEYDKDAVSKANLVYEAAKAYQRAILKENQAVLDGIKLDYKQHKAAFTKAIAAGDKKLKESVYLDAVEEAACQEVEDVICGAIGKEELSKICNASKAVKDADVSDDPDKLTYGQNCYTHNGSYVPTAGTVDSTIVGKHESAEFSGMLY